MKKCETFSGDSGFDQKLFFKLKHFCVQFMEVEINFLIN